MKAIVYTEYGSPDVLQFKDVEKPITLSPLSFKDALVALLKTRPEPKEKKKLKKTKEKTGG